MIITQRNKYSWVCADIYKQKNKDKKQLLLREKFQLVNGEWRWEVEIYRLRGHIRDNCSWQYPPSTKELISALLIYVMKNTQIKDWVIVTDRRRLRRHGNSMGNPGEGLMEFSSIFVIYFYIKLSKNRKPKEWNKWRSAWQ